MTKRTDKAEEARMETVPAIFRNATVTAGDETVAVELINPDDPVEKIFLVQRKEKAAAWLINDALTRMVAATKQIIPFEG